MSAPVVTRPQAPSPAPPPPPPAPAGRMVLGGLLVLLGVAWLLDVTGAYRLRWQAVLAGALMVVGAVVLATARRGHHGGLMFLGVVLSGLLLVTSVAPTPVATPFAGAGDRAYRPATMAELERSYELGAGPLLLDLTAVQLPAGEQVRVSASVGAGELTVQLPEGATVDVRASSGAGDVTVDGRTQNGLGVEMAETIRGTELGGRMALELSVGVGRIEVRR